MATTKKPAARAAKTDKPKVCGREGCRKPRWTLKSGRTIGWCRDHELARGKLKTAKRREARADLAKAEASARAKGGEPVLLEVKPPAPKAETKRPHVPAALVEKRRREKVLRGGEGAAGYPD